MSPSSPTKRSVEPGEKAVQPRSGVSRSGSTETNIGVIRLASPDWSSFVSAEVSLLIWVGQMCGQLVKPKKTSRWRPAKSLWETVTPVWSVRLKATGTAGSAPRTRATATAPAVAATAAVTSSAVLILGTRFFTPSILRQSACCARILLSRRKAGRIAAVRQLHGNAHLDSWIPGASCLYTPLNVWLK